jgi:hypothetical protein
MKRSLFTTAFALCLAGIGSAHADASRAVSVRPEFGKDLLVDVSSGLATAAKRSGAATQTWRWSGVARIDNNDTPDVLAEARSAKSIGSIDVDGGAEAVSRSGTQRWVAVNLDTGFEYSVDMPRAFAHQIHRQAELTGSNMGDPRTNNRPQAIEDAGNEAKGWSNNDDGRTRRFDNTSYPFTALGQMGGGENSGCSGTLIARNIVLTAAHCIYSLDSASFYSKTATRFRPGREGGCNNASCEPYGEHSAIWYFTPAEFREAANPWPYDYGIMVVGTYPGDQASWLGYYALVDDALKDFCSDHQFGDGRCFNRGYPACGLSNAPQGAAGTLQECVQGWAYQDVDNCEIGSFSAKAKDGWNSRASVSCDLSGGHSGSALFTDIWAGNKKVVFGVASWENCKFCTPETDFPNLFRRISPDVIDAISYFKAAYP